MARTTAVPGPAASWSVAVVTPAAIERMRGMPSAPSTAHVAGTSAGFTATMAPSAATGSSTTLTPGNRASSSSRRAGSFSTTAMSAGSAQPDPSRPPRRASPIFPPPTICSRTMAPTLVLHPGTAASHSPPGRVAARAFGFGGPTSPMGSHRPPAARAEPDSTHESA